MTIISIIQILNAEMNLIIIMLLQSPNSFVQVALVLNNHLSLGRYLLNVFQLYLAPHLPGAHSNIRGVIYFLFKTESVSHYLCDIVLRHLFHNGFNPLPPRRIQMYTSISSTYCSHSSSIFGPLNICPRDHNSPARCIIYI